ncbi:MAG: NmrA-like family [Bradyrhizobium sp.]|jgi:uncharacterized protein YbjT (DUF2867 family)|nr:NmrA-like family [Bradyrhizobium sp.]MEA2867625.1 NAD(P)H-binding [Bradyrhizobium sp.]
MRVLVLGATGGTGREIVREAGAQGHSVVALVRSRTKATDPAPSSLRATHETSRPFRARSTVAPA